MLKNFDLDPQHEQLEKLDGDFNPIVGHLKLMKKTAKTLMSDNITPFNAELVFVRPRRPDK